MSKAGMVSWHAGSVQEGKTEESEEKWKPLNSEIQLGLVREIICYYYVPAELARSVGKTKHPLSY